MSKYEIRTTPIEGPLVIAPEVEGEARDFLFDLENSAEEYKLMEIPEELTHHTNERFARGVIKGLHFQRKDSRGVLISAAAGRLLAVAVDLRPESKTFGASHSVELTTENERMLYVPPYFAHGFLTLEHNTEVVCNYTGEYDPATISPIVWDDEILAINWQFERFDIDERRLNISPKDKKAPSFRSYNQNLLWVNRPKKSKYAVGY